MDDLTIIITTYNSSTKIIALLNWIYNNKYDGKLLIADDASTDDTIEIINNFIIKNNIKNLFLLQSKVNLGLPKNRINCLKEIKTNFITFVDHDDFISIKALRQIYDKRVDDKVLCSEEITILNKNIIKIRNLNFKNELNYSLCSSYSICGKVFPTKIFMKMKIEPSAQMGEDMNSIQLIMNYGIKFIKTNESFYYYLINKDSMSNSSNKDINQKNNQINELIINKNCLLKNINNKKYLLDIDVYCNRYIYFKMWECGINIDDNWIDFINPLNNKIDKKFHNFYFKYYWDINKMKEKTNISNKLKILFDIFTNKLIFKIIFIKRFNNFFYPIIHNKKYKIIKSNLAEFLSSK